MLAIVSAAPQNGGSAAFQYGGSAASQYGGSAASQYGGSAASQDLESVPYKTLNKTIDVSIIFLLLVENCFNENVYINCVKKSLLGWILNKVW